MGMAFRFQCTACAYGATVSGRRDIGELAVVDTRVCLSCREVVDVRIGSFGRDGPSGDPELDRSLGLCPLCSGKNLRAWPRQRPCPRCGARMVAGESPELLWD